MTLEERENLVNQIKGLLTTANQLQTQFLMDDVLPIIQNAPAKDSSTPINTSNSITIHKKFLHTQSKNTPYSMYWNLNNLIAYEFGLSDVRPSARFELYFGDKRTCYIQIADDNNSPTGTPEQIKIVTDLAHKFITLLNGLVEENQILPTIVTPTGYKFFFDSGDIGRATSSTLDITK